MARYRVTTAKSGGEAVRLAVGLGRIDVLITDLVMPAMSGPALAEALVARSPGTRVLLLSGYSDEQVARHGVERGTYAFLAKPFEPASLRARVAELLQKATSWHQRGLAPIDRSLPNSVESRRTAPTALALWSRACVACGTPTDIGT